MTYDEAVSEAVQGARVTCDQIQSGCFVDYQFAGLRIVFPSGDHSGFHATDKQRAAEWSIVPVEVPSTLYMSTKGGGKSNLGLHSQAWGRALRPMPAQPDNVGKWGLPPKPVEDELITLTPFELAQLQGERLRQDAEPAKWGKPVVQDKWGRKG